MHTTTAIPRCEFTHPEGVPQTPHTIVGKYAKQHTGTYHCRTYRGTVQVVRTDLLSGEDEPRTVIFSSEDIELRRLAQASPEALIAQALKIPVNTVQRDLYGGPIEARVSQV